MKSTDVSFGSLPAVIPSSGRRIGPVFLTLQNLIHYHRSVVLIKIYSLHHNESFNPLLPLFLFDSLTKRWEIAKRDVDELQWLLLIISHKWPSASQPLVVSLNQILMYHDWLCIPAICYHQLFCRKGGCVSQPFKWKTKVRTCCCISGIHMLSISSHGCTFQPFIVKVNISTSD